MNDVDMLSIYNKIGWNIS